MGQFLKIIFTKQIEKDIAGYEYLFLSKYVVILKSKPEVIYFKKKLSLVPENLLRCKDQILYFGDKKEIENLIK